MNEFPSLPADLNYLGPLIDSLDTGFTAVDAEGRFQIWNQANTRILGKGAALDLNPNEWPAYYGLHCPIQQRLLNYEELPLFEAVQQQKTCEREIILINDQWPQGRWIKVMARPLYNQDREFIGGVAVTQDITKEKASSLASQMMSWFFSASDDGIISVNLEGTVLLWNPGAERMFGWSAEEMIGRSVTLLVPEERVHEIALLVERAKQNLDLPPSEAEVKHKSGHTVVISRSITPIRNSAGAPMGGVVVARDISRIKQTERQLEDSRQQIRLLSTRQQNLLEQQLLGVARELHDEFGQELAAMKFEIAWLERHIAQENPKIEERLESLNQLLDSTIAGLRRVSRQMRPPLLQELGLCHAIDDLLSNLAGRFSLKTMFECNCQPLQFVADASLALYRIIQEALTNVVKHAQADEVWVDLHHLENRIVVRVRDNGLGIPAERQQGGSNFGILGMQERAHNWSGTVQVNTYPSGGTEVKAEFPAEKLLTT